MFKHLLSKYILNAYFLYKKRKFKVMYLSLDEFKNNESNYGKDCSLFNYNDKFKDDKIRIHYSCFHSARKNSIEYFLRTKRFFPKLSFLLFNESIRDFIGACDIQFVLGTFVLSNVSILKEYRGNDFGYKIVNDSLVKAKELNVREVYLIVNPNNLVAVNLYKKFGFEFI